MLVLTRKAQEKIRIGENIFVQVVEIRGNKIRLGVTAPPDVRVRRAELAPLPTDQVAIRPGRVDLDQVEAPPTPRGGKRAA